MTVQVLSLQGGNRHGATRFSDTMISPDQPFGFGNNWNPSQNLVNPPVGNAYAGQDVAAAWNRGVTGISYTNPGGGGFSPVVFATPIPIDWSFCRSKNQFSEIQYVSTSAGIIRPVVFCFYDPNGANIYLLELDTDILQFELARWNNTTQTQIVAPSVATAFVANDVLRLEVDTTTTPGTTIVRGKKNGVTVATFNDNSGSKLTSGLFGFGGAGANPAVVAVLKNYNGGIM